METRALILVVDDDVEDHQLLTEYLHENGLTADAIRFERNGRFALEYLQQLTDADLPSLIVLDLNMPILNGTQTLTRLKELDRYKAIPVIVYSTSGNEVERDRCLELHAVDFLIKPSTFAEGKEMVKAFLRYVNLE